MIDKLDFAKIKIFLFIKRCHYENEKANNRLGEVCNMFNDNRFIFKKLLLKTPTNLYKKDNTFFF